MTSTFPCKDCPDRYIGCHSSCERYLTVKRNRDKQKEETRLKMEAFAYSQDRIARVRNELSKAQRDNRGYKRFRQC